MQANFITEKDYLEIKNILDNIVVKINRSENSNREFQRKNNTKYGHPDINYFAGMSNIKICRSLKIEENLIMYIVPSLSFHNFLNIFLPKAIEKYPNLFGTGNAKDVLYALYQVSEYDSIGDIERYTQFLIDTPCCYFLLRKKNGALSRKVFRLDLFRHVLLDKKTKLYEFVGGIMHSFRHCSWRGMKLSHGNGEIELNNIWDLPFFLGKTILLNTILDSETPINVIFCNKKWNIVYFYDDKTEIYYLKTAFHSNE